MLFNVKTNLPDGDEFNSIDRFNEWKAAAIAELPSDAKPQKGDMLRDRDYNYRNDGKLIFYSTLVGYVNTQVTRNLFQKLHSSPTDLSTQQI